MQIKSAVFQMSARDLESCPESAFPEFAFIGRSNVGKSSMINMLTNKDTLAKVSATPGKTQMINFFLINGAWVLVDLPGYGYAKVAKSEKVNFNEFVSAYILQRPNLRKVFVLIDSRLPPQAIDLSFIEWLSGCDVPYQLIFTKTDKQSPTKTRANEAAFLQSLSENVPAKLPTILSSSKDRSGRIAILKTIQQAIS